MCFDCNITSVNCMLTIHTYRYGNAKRLLILSLYTLFAAIYSSK